MPRGEELVRLPEKGIRPDHRLLFSEYVRFLDEAADAGRTRPYGRTPREHLVALEESGGLPPEDLRRLTELVENLVYGGAEGDPEEGLRLCRRLRARLPDLPPLPEPARDHGEKGTVERRLRAALRRVPSSAWKVILGLLLLAGLAAGPRAIPGGCAGASSGGGGGGGGGSGTRGSGYSHRHRGARIENHTGWSSGEAAAVRRSYGEWSRVAERPSFVDIRAPSRVEGEHVATGPGMDLETGVDGNILGWREPARPGMGAHHRTEVYDRVDEQCRFGRRTEPLRPARGAGAEGAVERDFEAVVRLREGRPVPVPSSAPDARVTEWSPEEEVWIRFRLDPADGLVAIADRDVTTRLRYRLASGGGYLDASLPETPWGEVRLEPMPVPEPLRRDAREVLDAIGGLPQPTYRETVRRLQAYFCSFVVAPIEPGEVRESDFLTLALARKGVCRHRSRCFVIVANVLGLPARLVENEIHSFAEVQLPDGRWRALEFRLFEGARPPEREPGREEDWREGAPPPDQIAFLLALILFVGIVWQRTMQEQSGHRLAPGRRDGRTRLRARRDADAGRPDHSVRALATHALRRLGERLGVDVRDPEALAGALQARRASHMLTAQVRTLLQGEGQGVGGRYQWNEIYWCARAVLRWLGEEES